jgi:hypothetical protein
MANDPANTIRVPQKPVFIIQPFDPSNPEHMRGNMTLVINKAFATSLSKFIGESELSEDEGFIFAMRGNIQRWFKARYSEIKKRKQCSVEESQQPLSDDNKAP